MCAITKLKVLSKVTLVCVASCQVKAFSSVLEALRERKQVILSLKRQESQNWKLLSKESSSKSRPFYQRSFEAVGPSLQWKKHKATTAENHDWRRLSLKTSRYCSKFEPTGQMNWQEERERERILTWVWNLNMMYTVLKLIPPLLVSAMSNHHTPPPQLLPMALHTQTMR